MRNVVLRVAIAMVAFIGLAQGSTAQDLYNCGDFATQEEAQRVLNADPSDPHRLDGDNDGWACESVFGYIGSEQNAYEQGGSDDGNGTQDPIIDEIIAALIAIILEILAGS